MLLLPLLVAVLGGVILPGTPGAVAVAAAADGTENLGKLSTLVFLASNATAAHNEAAACAVAAINSAALAAPTHADAPGGQPQTQLVELLRVAEATSAQVPGRLYVLRLQLGLSAACRNDGLLRSLSVCPVAEGDAVLCVLLHCCMHALLFLFQPALAAWA